MKTFKPLQTQPIALKNFDNSHLTHGRHKMTNRNDELNTVSLLESNVGSIYEAGNELLSKYNIKETRNRSNANSAIGSYTTISNNEKSHASKQNSHKSSRMEKNSHWSSVKEGLKYDDVQKSIFFNPSSGKFCNLNIFIGLTPVKYKPTILSNDLLIQGIHGKHLNNSKINIGQNLRVQQPDKRKVAENYEA